MTTRRALAQLLKHLAAAGVTHVPKVDLSKRPVVQSAGAAPAAGTATAPRLAGGQRVPTGPSGPSGTSESATAAPPAARSRTASAALPTAPQPLKRVPGLLGADDLQQSAVRVPGQLQQVSLAVSGELDTAADREAAMCSLRDTVAACQRCAELAGRRKQTVFGVGSVTARIMLIGEAPGQEEDETGEPFVGPAGQLLNKIITASQLRREDLYICNILRCRPPGNRTPLPQEAANCREFLDAQIKVVNPEFIICLGAVAAQNLLGVTTSITKLRNQFFEYCAAKVLCTYHPSYLLRNAEAKKLVWEDMKFFMRQLGVELK